MSDIFGTRFYKKETDEKKYIELVDWCNNHGGIINDLGTYYEVIRAPEPSLDDKVETLTVAIQQYMDNTAKNERGYDDLRSAISYMGSSNARWNTEANAAFAWRDAVWAKANELLNLYILGDIPEMTAEEVIAQLPKINWGTEDL